MAVLQYPRGFDEALGTDVVTQIDDPGVLVDAQDDGLHDPDVFALSEIRQQDDHGLRPPQLAVSSPILSGK